MLKALGIIRTYTIWAISPTGEDARYTVQALTMGRAVIKFLKEHSDMLLFDITK